MFKTPILANSRNNSVVGAALPAEHNALTLRSIGPIVSEIWQDVKNTYSCKFKKQQCSQRSATCWEQRVDTQEDWPNSFWDMTKCLILYSCKLKKQQCCRRSATCWTQRVDSQVDWPNSFLHMTECLKHLFLQIEKQLCSRRSATCWAQRVDSQVDWPIVSEIWQNV